MSAFKRSSLLFLAWSKVTISYFFSKNAFDEIQSYSSSLILNQAYAHFELEIIHSNLIINPLEGPHLLIGVRTLN